MVDKNTLNLNETCVRIQNCLCSDLAGLTGKLHLSYEPLKRQSQLQQTTNFVTTFLIFEKNKV